MNSLIKIFAPLTKAAVLTVLVSALPVAAQPEVDQTSLVDLDTKIASVNKATREISFQSGMGLGATLYVPKSIDIDDLAIGDRLKGTYLAAVETEIRTPTAEELAEPWKVIEEGVETVEPGQQTVEASHIVRAVVTVAGLAKAGGGIVVMDSRNMMHLIAGVEPEKFGDLKEGQKIVVVFAQALVLSLEKAS